jgi:hypothetical protein
MRRSLGKYSSLADSGQGVQEFLFKEQHGALEPHSLAMSAIGKGDNNADRRCKSKTMKGVITAQEQEKVKSWEKLEVPYCGSHNEQNQQQVMSKFCLSFACFSFCVGPETRHYSSEHMMPVLFRSLEY